MNIENDLTFFQWLKNYEYMSKKEFKELPKYKQENYKLEYEIKYKTPNKRRLNS